MPTIVETLQRGIAYQNVGQNDNAARHYEAVLKAAPNQPDALHLLGLVESARGNHERGVELIQAAIRIMPDSAIFFSNLGVTLRKAGRVDEAIGAYRKSLELNPQSADANFNLAKSYKLKKDLDSAARHFRQATEFNPAKASAWLGLMNTYEDRGDRAAAIEIAGTGLAHCPNSAELQMNLGVVLRRNRQVDEAIAAFRKAVTIDPSNVEAHCKLITNLTIQNRLEEAKQQLSVVDVPANQNNASLWNSKGLFCKAIGNTLGAIQAFRQALQIDPNSSTSYANLGNALRKIGQHSEALKCLKSACEVDSSSDETQVNLAATLLCIGEFDEARKSLEEIVVQRPDFADAHDNLLMCLQYHPDVGPKELLAEHVKWDQLHTPSFEPASFDSFSANRPIRLGFVSADLGNHPVGYFTAKLLTHLDRKDFATCVFSDRVGTDPLGSELRKLPDDWHDVVGMTDDALCSMIRAEEIDILFDLAGHTAGHRLMTFARRAAAVQITWAGYVGTTGVKQIDYLLADRFHVPTELEQYYTERVLRMPHDYICYAPPEHAPPVTHSPAADNGYVTFAAMANPAKVNEQVLKLWAQILQQLPQARLVLCYVGWRDPANVQRVERFMSTAGVAGRVEFDHKDGHENLLQFYGTIDIALDTFPYSGGLTTCEALWMGVPTITLPGDKFCGRHSLSHLSNVGLTDLVAGSPDEYVRLATELASDVHRLASLRSSLRERTANSPLCDGPLFAQDFGQLMRGVLESHGRER